MNYNQANDIPASKDPYAKHAYTKNFPDSPDLESSQTVEKDPQTDFDDQVAHGIQFDTSGQGNNQRKEVLGGAKSAQAEAERRKLKKKIRDIETVLNSGWYRAYKRWLILNLICCLSAAPCLIGLILELIVFARNPQDTSIVQWIWILLIWFTWCIWLAQQCLVAKNAMNYNNLESAKRAFKSMIAFSIYHLATFVVLVWLCEGSKFEEERSTIYAGLLAVGYGIPTFIRLFGAKKAINWLEKRYTLVLELENQYGYQEGESSFI